MEPTKIAKQIINFQKTGFDTAFNAAKIMQDCADAATGKILAQNETMVKDGLAFTTEWMNELKQNRDDFRQSASDRIGSKFFEMNNAVVDQIQAQAETYTKTMFDQAARFFQRGSQLYGGGLETQKTLLDSYRQGVDAAFKTVEDMLQK